MPALLIASLACNALALVLPFMEMSRFLGSTKVYSLPRSVELLWEAKLHAIAVLVLGFSIVFPFAKLFAQGWSWFGRTSSSLRRTTLSWLERLGKWSFLDIFVVCIILILTTDQFLVGATPKYGLYLFIAAIALNMTSAALIAVDLHDASGSGANRQVLARRPGWPRWTIPPFLVATAGVLTAALTVPYLEIDQFLLAGHAFSVTQSVRALWAESFHGTAVLVAVTLVAMPIVSVLLMAIVWFVPLTETGRWRCRRALELSWQWSMLDVFALGLIVFLLEGRDLIDTEIRPGFPWFLGAAVGLTTTHVLIVWLSGRRM